MLSDFARSLLTTVWAVLAIVLAFVAFQVGSSMGWPTWLCWGASVVVFALFAAIYVLFPFGRSD